MRIERRLAMRVRKLRIKARMTQEELAERSGLEYKHIQKLEGKKPHAVTLTTLEKRAKAFKVPAWRLIKFPDSRR